MINRFAAILLLAAAPLLIASCNKSSKTSNVDDRQKGKTSKRVDWEKIPSQYSKNIDEKVLNLQSIDRVYVDAFGFQDDVEVVYSNEVAQGSAKLRIFSVISGFASFGRIDQTIKGTNLLVKNYGQYECSIQIKNGQITNLDGGCYIRLEIVMPAGAQIEVYNVERLISKRFFAMDTETFLKKIDAASWKEQKFEVIEEFVSSYSGLNKKPELTAAQLGVVIEDFSFSDPQLEALRRLHSYVTDRENLSAMIDDVFAFSRDRESARRIVGL